MQRGRCSHDGCERPVYARTWCSYHYQRRLRDKDTWTTVLVRGDDEGRFWAKVRKTGTCWHWTAALNRDGYGRFSAQNRFEFAHRFSYELHKGPIPDGLVIDHLCRVRDCVNPDHLEAVTHRENILRGEADAARYVLSTHCVNGHELTPENTYIRPNGNRSCRTCLKQRSMQWGRRHGVKPARPPLPITVCPVCGVEFKPATRYVVCCSRSCGQRLRFHGAAARGAS